MNFRVVTVTARKVAADGDASASAWNFRVVTVMTRKLRAGQATTVAIRRTASSRMVGEVAKLSRTNPRPACAP